MTILNEYLKFLKPLIQNSNSDVDRHPTLNFGTGLTVTADAANDRNTVTVNNSDLNNVSQFTGSVNSVSVWDTATPRFASTGLISSGSEVVLSCTLKPNTHYAPTAQFILKDTLDATIAVTNQIVQITFVSGATPTINYDATSAAGLNTSALTISGSIDEATEHLVLHATSNTGSNYTFYGTADGPEIGF